MQINYKKLKTLPVQTESGSALGRVIDVEIDVNNHNISKYVVSSWPAALLKREKLIISPEQIVSIDADKVIVKDGAVRVAEAKSVFSPEPAKEAAAAVSAEMRD